VGVVVTKLNADQIYRDAVAAGFDNATARIMTAIALAESGGNSQAHNGVAPDNSYGLWQINMLGAMGPQRRQQFGISSNDALYDPLTNAKAAYKVYQQQGLKAWSTYTGGSYKAFLPEVNTAADRQNNLMDAGKIGDPSGPNLYSVVTGSADAVTNPFGTVWDTVNNRWFWVRIAFIVAGLIIVLIGIRALVEGGTFNAPSAPTPIRRNGSASALPSKTAEAAEAV
jgi:Lysozyme like domain